MTTDEILLYEIRLKRLLFPFLATIKTKHDKLLQLMLKRLEDGVPYAQIKKEVSKLLRELYEPLRDDINQEIYAQREYILADSVKTIGITIMGLTIKEMIDRRRRTHENTLAVAYLNNDLEINKNKSKFIRAVTSIIEQATKAGREKAYNRLPSSSVYGWMHISILDRVTSGICITLANRIYLKSEYKNRGNIPYIPNVSTHYNCRAMLIALYSKGDINKYKEMDIFTFSQKFQNEFRKLIGDKKYKLMQDKKLSISQVFSFKRKEFLTIEEILKL